MKNTLTLCFFYFILPFLIVSCGAHSPRVLEEKYKTIHISTFKNKTHQFALEERLTPATIAAFQRDGRLKVTAKSIADLELSATIEQVQVTPVAFSDLDRAVGYSMNVLVMVKLIDTQNGDVDMEERPFRATGSFLLSNTIGTTKTRDISEIIADQILSYYMEGW